MKKKLLILFVAICMICTLIPFSVFSAESSETVSISVTYKQSDARKMLTMINDFRAGDDAWVFNKDGSTKDLSGLNALVYDYTLEEVAMQRAAEIALHLDHTRPNNTSFKTLVGKSYSACAENCAAGYASSKSAFESWQETNQKYSGQSHRRVMLSSSYNAVGIACAHYNGQDFWVQVFGTTASPDKTKTAVNNSATSVNVQINPNLIEYVKISTSDAVPVSAGLNRKAELPELTTKILLTESYPGSKYPCTVTPTYTWSSSDISVAKVSGDKLVGVSTGKATLTASALGTSYNIPVKVEKKACVFSDVETDSYCYDAVLWASDRGITNGIDKTHFAPEDDCTRAQIVTFLWRAKGSPKPKTTKNPFTDMDKDDYCYDAVLWAVENEIAKGKTSSKFAPDAPCTRDQAVVFLWRADNELDPFITKNPFKDVEAGSYYYNAVLWAVGAGITEGIDSTHFGPDKVCTRGQIVTFLYRDMA